MKTSSRCPALLILGLALLSAGHMEKRAPLIRPGLGPSPISARLNFSFAKVPLYFIPNLGQVDERALFYAITPSYTLWMTKEGLVFDSSANLKRDITKIKFLGAKEAVRVIAFQPAEHRVNYFMGRDPDKWRTDIPTSQAVTYDGLYPGIDLKIYGVDAQIEYDWIVKPGGTVGDIRFAYRNIRKTEIDQDGNLIIHTECGEFRHKKPVGYQTIDRTEREIQVSFKAIAEDTYGFQAEAFNPDYPLVIDPMILVTSTYLGASGGDGSSDIAVDGAGSVYLTGGSDASGFPVFNPFDPTWNGSSDAFVAKFTPDGRALVYSTYLGGSAWDSGSSIALDGSGCAYITGRTVSSDFPVFHAFDSTFNGFYDDAFVAKLSAAGNALEYSTFLGGSDTESGTGIAVDSAGSAYVTGETSSPDFPVLNAYDPYWSGSSDVFVVKFTPDGGSLVFSTFLGGSSIDEGADLAVDSAGSVYVTGSTYSMFFPVLNAYDPTQNGVSDAFLTKFAPDGRSLVYSTFLGGAESEFCNGIAVDSAGSAYVTGSTYSSDFPAVKAYDSAQNGGQDAFVAKFSPDGKALAYSTYLGGSAADSGWGIAVDSAGAAYVVGFTYSKDFPVFDALSSTLKNSSEAFVTKFAPEGNTLAASTFLGGNSADYGWAIDVDAARDVYVTGNTGSSDFPVSNAYDPTYNGNTDVFMTKLRLIPPYPPRNFRLQQQENSYIFFKESVNRLSWTANPENTIKIAYYRLYRKAKDAADGSYQWLADIHPSGTSFLYDDRGLKKTARYAYRITSVDENGRESGYAEISNEP
ncbi:MAG: SBBP repeat-containing protein [Candidatus Aminicenantes bacterium]|nr:SBBP repeat-containing protein [Candidatus Aminicenantes bacterium]